MGTYLAHLRHRLGFGVQSPWAFYLVRFVLQEKLPFYAFNKLRELRKNFPHHSACFSRGHDELIFRLTYWQKAKQVFVIGIDCPTLSALYIRSCTKNAKIVCICENITLTEHKALEEKSIDVYCGDVLENLEKRCPANGFEFVLIAHNKDAWPIYSFTADHTNDESMIVVEHLEKKQGKQLWSKIQKDGRARASFHLGRTGLLFFNTKRARMYYNL